MRVLPPPYFFKIIILYAPITSNECLAWFHSFGLSRTARQAKNETFLPTMGFEPKTFRFVVGLATDWLAKKVQKEVPNASKLSFRILQKKNLKNASTMYMNITQMHLVFQPIESFWKKNRRWYPSGIYVAPTGIHALGIDPKWRKLERGNWALASCKVSLKFLQRFGSSKSNVWKVYWRTKSDHNSFLEPSNRLRISEMETICRKAFSPSMFKWHTMVEITLKVQVRIESKR